MIRFTVFLLTIPLALAKPWHQVNVFDVNGNVCPAVVRVNQVCPTVCTTKIDLCPRAIRPEPCPSGQFYCPDGACHSGLSFTAACKAVPSVCSCKTSFTGVSESQLSTANDPLVPCLLNKPFKVNVSGYDESDPGRNQPLINACTAALGLTAGEGPFLLRCANHEPVSMSFMEPEFVAFYSCLLVEGLILSLYYLYRRWQTLLPFGQKNKMQLSDYDNEELSSSMFVGSQEIQMTDIRVSISKTEPEKKSAPLRFTGYRKDTLGTIVLWTVVFATFAWFLIIAILIGDYYEIFSDFKYKDRSLLFINHDNLSRIFIVVWHILTVWLVFLQVNSAWLQTYFHQKTALAKATSVLVEKRVEPAVQFKGLGPIVEFVHSVEERFRRYTKTDVSLKLTSVKLTSSGRRYIEFECVRYVFNEASNSFEPYHFEVGPSNKDLHDQSVRGLGNAEAMRRQELGGPNEILFRIDTFSRGLIKEFTGIFYVYQLMSLLIWYYYAYYYMAVVLTLVIVSSGISKVIVSTRAQKQVLEMATFHGTQRVLRDGVWSTVNTRELIPGDVIQLNGDQSMLSVDCVLVEGDAVVDESSLTGEALPVAKFSVKNDSSRFNRKEGGKVSTLYAGCHVLEVRPETPGSPVKAVVLATGASTTKGRMVRDMLYPLPVMFVFIEHLKIVFPILIFWGILMLIASILVLDSTSVDSWFYGMFTISQVLSPLLPAVLVIGQSISAERLKSKSIMCVDLNRITLAGKVKVFCFDKTGTLTREGLDILGAHSIQGGAFDSVQNDFEKFPSLIQKTMQVCHSLSVVNEKHVGNFVDAEMFKATGSQLLLEHGVTKVIPNTSATELSTLRLIKRFEFVHSHAYMSVIAQDETSGRLYVFLKGSFEKIKEIVDPQSLPNDYEEVAKKHSGQGCYVLGIACKILPANITASEVYNWSRDEVERGASAIGLLLFRNELKDDTEYILNQLREGGCRNVMITGDHVRTAIHIARVSGMIRPTWQGENPIVLLADVDKRTKSVFWTNVDTDEKISQAQVEKLVQTSRLGTGFPVELAVTGPAFNELCYNNWLSAYLEDTRIFARMKPEDKVKCVRLHMESHVTAMCGDGGNDAGALKAAHAGIALSEAQSSVVAHFSSRDRSLRSCLTLLKEARCSLDVSFSAYKYLLMYGEILTFVGLIQYYFVVNMSQAMWVLIDGGTVPVCWALTMARPSHRLANSRPTARLLGPQTVFSVLGQVLINLVFLIILVSTLYRQGFYRCHEFDGNKYDLRRWWELADNYEGSITGIMATFQILFAAIAFNLGSKYRLGFFKNYPFMVVSFLMFALLSYVTLADPNALGCLFHVNCGTPDALASLGYTSNVFAPSVYYSASGHNVIPTSFRWVLWTLCVVNMFVVVGWEYFVILGPVRSWVRSALTNLGWNNHFGHNRSPLRL